MQRARCPVPPGHTSCRLRSMCALCPVAFLTHLPGSPRVLWPAQAFPSGLTACADSGAILRCIPANLLQTPRAALLHSSQQPAVPAQAARQPPLALPGSRGPSDSTPCRQCGVGWRACTPPRRITVCQAGSQPHGQSSLQPHARAAHACQAAPQAPASPQARAHAGSAGSGGVRALPPAASPLVRPVAGCTAASSPWSLPRLPASPKPSCLALGPPQAGPLVGSTPHVRYTSRLGPGYAAVYSSASSPAAGPLQPCQPAQAAAAARSAAAAALAGRRSSYIRRERKTDPGGARRWKNFT